MPLLVIRSDADTPLYYLAYLDVLGKYSIKLKKRTKFRTAHVLGISPYISEVEEGRMEGEGRGGREING